MNSYKSVDQYISSAPKDLQAKLKSLRLAIKKSAPKAEEKIGYGMPGYYQNGPLVYFALAKKHIGFYPIPSAIREFKEELSKYDTDKGTIRFSLEKPLPLGLISKMVKFRVKANTEKVKSGKEKKAKK